MFEKRVDSTRNHREPRPETSKWLPRSVALPDSEPVNRNRREFLAKALGVFAATLAIGKLGSEAVKYSAEINETVDDVRSRVKLGRNHEKLKPGSLVPDDERDGREFMTGLVPNYNSMPLIGGYKYGKEAIDSGFSQFVSTLESGTEVSVLIPKDTTEVCKKTLNAKFPGIVFNFYELPMAAGGFNFVRNVVFPTGKKDKDGKSVMISSSADTAMFQQSLNKANLLNPVRRVMDPSQSAVDWFLSRDEKEETFRGLTLFGDEFLAESNPEKFIQNYVPVIANNGDVRATRLPNGEVGLLVGKRSLSESVQALRLKEGRPLPQNEDEFRDFDLIEPQSFAEWMEKVRVLYQEHFGVKDVVFLDEPYIRDLIEVRKGKVQQSAMQGYNFFDSDMIVNTSTDMNGVAVAFCTNYKGGDEREADYTNRIAKQLAAVGYEIEHLPCGKDPEMNYANAVITMKDGEKIVRLPQYGIPQDAAVEGIYARRGFQVVKIDMSFIEKMTPSQREKTGSVHCAFTAMT